MKYTAFGANLINYSTWCESHNKYTCIALDWILGLSLPHAIHDLPLDSHLTQSMYIRKQV